MHGIPIPKNGKQALDFDKHFGKKKWSDAIKKEIAKMIEFKVFKVHHNRTQFPTKEGWQFAPLHWVYAVKHDGRHKARLVIGGHVTDAEGYNTFASTICMEHVRLQVFLTSFFGEDMLSGDIGSAYLNAERK